MTTKNQITSTAPDPTFAVDTTMSNDGKRTGLNVALYLGSALIVFATIFFAGSADPILLTPTLIGTTLLLYLIGFILYGRVDFLRPVAKSFIITSLFTTLTWSFTFNSSTSYLSLIDFTGIGGLLGALALTLLSGLASPLMNSRVLASVSYIGAYYFVSLVPSVFNMGLGSAYFKYTIWALLSLGIALSWYKRAKWIPIPFRGPTRNSAKWLMPLVCFGCAIAPANTNCPMLTTIVFVIALGQYIYGYLRDHSANKILAIRVLSQSLLFSLIHDIMVLAKVPQSTMNFSLGLVLFASSALQLAYSLFIERSEHAVAPNENIVTIAAAVGLLASTLFFTSLSGESQSVMRIFAYTIVSGFGIGLSYKYNRANWLILPFLALLLLPIEIGLNLSKPAWTQQIYMIAYAAVSVIITCIYALIRNFEGQKREIYNVISGALLIALFVIIAISIQQDCAPLGWLIATVILTARAYIGDKKEDYEWSIYAAVFCLCALSNEIFGSIGDYSKAGWTMQKLSLWCSVVNANIAAIALAAASFWKERNTKSEVRAKIGYGILSAVFLMSAVTMRSDYDSIILCLLFLLEQIALLALGYIWKRDWLVKCSATLSLIIVFYMTTGFGYLWLFTIGLSLIIGVSIVIVRENRKRGLNAAETTELSHKPSSQSEAGAIDATKTQTASHPNTTEKETGAPKSAKTTPSKPEQVASSGRLGGKPHSANYN